MAYAYATCTLQNLGSLARLPSTKKTNTNRSLFELKGSSNLKEKSTTSIQQRKPLLITTGNKGLSKQASHREGKENVSLSLKRRFRDSTSEDQVSAKRNSKQAKILHNESSTTKVVKAKATKALEPLPPLIDPFESNHRAAIQLQGLNSLLSSTKEGRGGRDNICALHVDKRHVQAPFRLEKRVMAVGAAAAAGVPRESMKFVLRNQQGPSSSAVTLGKAGSFEVTKFLGGGTYGSVFAVQSQKQQQQRGSIAASVAPASSETTAAAEAMKVEHGVRHLPWEVHVLRKLRKRVLGGATASSSSSTSSNVSPATRAREHELNDLVVSPSALVLYQDFACMVLPRAVGTLWHLSRSGGKVMPEICCAFYASRMCRAVELLFQADLIHGDLKLDNFLVVANTQGGGEKAVGGLEKAASLTLIDFGRCIDRRSYESGTRFSFNSSTLAMFGQDARELVCAAQWASRSTSGGDGGSSDGWVLELDLHCLAVSLLKLVVPSSQTVNAILDRHQQAFKDPKGSSLRAGVAALKVPRGWDSELWSTFIGDLLNPHPALGGSRGSTSFIKLLRVHRQKLEAAFDGQEKKLDFELKRQLSTLQ